MFHDVPARSDYRALEGEVLQLWAETRAFEQLREQTRGGPKWSFLDGPITANNRMGVHHGWGRTYKDLYNRYHAMLGQELRWQQGFDCQGLWVEVEVEKELGFTSKRQIEQYGVANFVNTCKERVFRYADAITEQSKRLGYWMDWDHSYYTLSDENNYGIWGFLKLCNERGWLRRGHDVMPWCPRCGTALSEHEIATEGYVEKTHLALTVAFPLSDRPGEALLAWTTTPWTLPANVAAAVNPELTYIRVEMKDQRRRTKDGTVTIWLVKNALERLATSFSLHPSAFVLHEERPGADLVGWRYDGPFDELEAQRGVMHRVVAWDEVSEDEGTGVVHIAPGAGKEDFVLGKEQELAVLAPLDDDGVYVAGYGWLSGRKASDVPEDVAAELERKGMLFARELYAHRYPVCWRCGTELVFRLVDEWLIGMDELRYQMMDSAREANWIPAFGLERELDWLRNMDDWMISKKRYWGLALPIYPCDACGHVTVVGSKEELQARAVAGWSDFEGHSPHRPWVDGVLIACEHCGKPVQRVRDVGNPWLDAGIVAFSTMSYAHNRAYWREWFPADLVLESFPGQFRNWFYALLAMSTALEGHAPFKTLLGHASVRDERGAEMHKSKGNSIPFEDAANWLGVEPLRWLFASAPLERNLLFGRGAVEESARRLQPLWEVYRFFVTYAKLEGWMPEQKAESRRQKADNSIDAWLLARLDQFVDVARERLDSYDARGFTAEVELFLDDLSNWYVRRSRRRFWGTGQTKDETQEAAGQFTEVIRRDAMPRVYSQQDSAFETLYVALVTVARVLAPVLPFLSEALYQNLVRSVDADAPASVHLTGYPEGSVQQTGDARQATRDSKPSSYHSSLDLDRRLLADMQVVRRVVGLGRVARKGAGLRVRQPLGRMLVALPRVEEREALLRHQQEVLEELNVKALDVLDSAEKQHGMALQQYQIKPNLRLLGPKLGTMLPLLRATLAALDPQVAAGLARDIATGRAVTLALPETSVTLQPDELLVEISPLVGYAVAQENGTQVALDTSQTPELRREGLARDLVRVIQELRKSAKLALSDRITLYLHTVQDNNQALVAALDEWSDFLRRETLAEALVLGALPTDAFSETCVLGEVTVTIGVVRRQD